MRIKGLIIYILGAILMSQTAFSQVNFFTDDETDTLSTNFYQRNKSITTLAVCNIPSLQVGASFFIHNAENRVSYYLELKSNFSRRYVIDGVECYGDGTREKEVAYNATNLNVGLARGFTRNWFIYGGVGVVVKHTSYENEVENNYRYTVPNNGVWFNLVGGVMYVLDNNFSASVGIDLYDRDVTLGLGYTW